MLRVSKALKDVFAELAKPGRKVTSREEWHIDAALVVDDTHYQINTYERISYSTGPTEWVIDGFRVTGDPITGKRFPIHFDKNFPLGDYIKKILTCHGQPNRIIISYKHVAPVIMTYTEMIKKWADRDELEITCRNDFEKLEHDTSNDEEHEDSCWRGDYTYSRFMRHIQMSLCPTC
jgi:hypothetical protein